MQPLDVITARFLAWLDEIARSAGFDTFATLTSNPPPEIVAIALLIPLALAALSRRVLSIVGTLLIVGVVWIHAFNVASLMPFATKLLYLAAFIIGFASLTAATRNRRMQTELAMLRAEVERLRLEDGQNYVRALKSKRSDVDRSDG